jgi:hypothetical protein
LKWFFSFIFEFLPSLTRSELPLLYFPSLTFCSRLFIIATLSLAACSTSILYFLESQQQFSNFKLHRLREPRQGIDECFSKQRKHRYLHSIRFSQLIFGNTPWTIDILSEPNWPREDFRYCLFPGKEPRFPSQLQPISKLLNWKLAFS